MFVRRNEDEIFESLLSRVISDTEINVTNPGGIARTLLEIVSKELGRNYALFDINISQMFLSTSGGDALDRLGSLLGVTRNTTVLDITASRSGVYFYLSDPSNHYPGRATTSAPENITIPKGTLLSTEPISSYNLPNTWRTTEQVIFSSGEYQVYVPVEPLDTITQTTSKGTLINHDVVTTSYSLGQNALYVYNRDAIQVESNRESDDNYRFRISKQLRQLATGNALAIRLAALSVTGVRDAKVYPLANGVGTFSVVVIPEVAGSANSDTILGNAVQAISAVKSAGDLAFIDLSRPHQVDVTGAITVSSTSNTAMTTLRRLAAESIVAYINSLSAGDKLSISRLTHAALSVSPEITGFVFRSGNGLEIDSTAQPISDYNVTKDDQLFAGVITIG